MRWFILFLLIFLSVPKFASAENGIYVYGNLNSRQHAYDAAIGYQFNNYIAGETRWIDEGKQAATTNVNRILNLDIVGTIPLPAKFSIFGFVGLSDTECIAGMGGFNGKNFGGGISYALNPRWSLRAEITRLNTIQTDINKMELFTYGSAGVSFKF